jgi:carbamoyltransferase
MMVVLGLGCGSWHDPSAALLVDGELVAAAEEERFSRKKHAPFALPIEAANYCLKEAGLQPNEVDVIACPWSRDALIKGRWRTVWRTWHRSLRTAFDMAKPPVARDRGMTDRLLSTVRAIGINPEQVAIDWVEHHVAHASAAYHFSGFPEAAVLTIDGVGEITTTLFAQGRNGSIEKLYEIPYPDSLGLFYSALTDYLGFEVNDGEFKVMGMAAYGDPSKVDMSGLLRYRRGDFFLDLSKICPPAGKCWRGHPFSAKLLSQLGPPRVGDEASEPYIHIAAAVQQLFETTAIKLVEFHLAPALERTRRLCFAGGCALNVALNRRLREHPLVDELFVPPAAGDGGTSLGAASYAAAKRGERISALKHAFYGPQFSNDEVVRELEKPGICFRKLDNPEVTAADLLAQGQIVARFQGRMEFGPRALGNRSILGHPGLSGTSDLINETVKFREKWRPFCPAILEEIAPQILNTRHRSPFMNDSFRVQSDWRSRIAEAVHIDGTIRPQIVCKAIQPRFHRLISQFEIRTGLPCVINTSLNRRGEPIVCRPCDAIDMFLNSGLKHLFIEDYHVTKTGGDSAPDNK